MIWERSYVGVLMLVDGIIAERRHGSQLREEMAMSLLILFLNPGLGTASTLPLNDVEKYLRISVPRL